MASPDDTDASTPLTEEREERAAELTRQSPEGRPAHPSAGPRQISLLLALLVVGLLALGLVAALFLSPALGAVLGIGGIVLFAANPAVWAAILRAEERRDVDKRLHDRHQT